MVAFQQPSDDLKEREVAFSKALRAAGPAGQELVQMVLNNLGLGPVLDHLKKEGEKGRMASLAEIAEKTGLPLPVVTAALVLLRYAGWAEGT